MGISVITPPWCEPAPNIDRQCLANGIRKRLSGVKGEAFFHRVDQFINKFIQIGCGVCHNLVTWLGRGRGVVADFGALRGVRAVFPIVIQ